jgi:hypothetical protein
MGSSTILDILASTIVAGLLLLIELRLDAQASETSTTYNMNYLVQREMTALVSIVESDFRKLGYCANVDDPKIIDPTQYIRTADTSSISFYTDTNNAGVVDSLKWYVGSPSELSDTPNPNDRYIYRQVNTGTAQKMNLGVTQFFFRYYDANGAQLATPMTAPSGIWEMQININVQSPAPITQQYNPDPYAFQMMWRQLRIASRNLRNR